MPLGDANPQTTRGRPPAGPRTGPRYSRGEYAQSVLGRERIFEYFSARHGTAVCLLRLNYAIDLRYGVLLDIGSKVFHGQPVDVSMGAVNVIWQGDANSICLRSFSVCRTPPMVLNLTGPKPSRCARWRAVSENCSASRRYCKGRSRTPHC